MKNNKNLILQWLSDQSWTLLPFQKQAWEEIHQGRSGLISVPTGAGKTYAAYLPALSKMNDAPKKGISILYLTPLKALINDLENALRKPISDLKLPYQVEKRTGDTTPSQKNRQKRSPPEVLLTTPESLAQLLTQKESPLQFSQLQMIIVDEWHEFLGTKRGALLELSLARLKKWTPAAQIWALTATIGNLQEAAQVCVGIDRSPVLITAQMEREVIIKEIIPEAVENFPWAGYLGIRMVPYVIEQLNLEEPSLIFTNTRSQAERWFQEILTLKPEWEPWIALHHSSIDKKSRKAIEENIKSGLLRFVVCTSALDLGIDFPLVKKVIQIGSPKSVSRLIQRAGRASHQPFAPCHIFLVPTHALQIFEINAYKIAIKEHIIEDRVPLKNCYDVLLQHMLTCAIGSGLEKEEFFNEIKTTLCFAETTRAEFEECLNFLITGGTVLTAYPEYKKLVLKEGLLVVEDPHIIRRHRMSIGTIISDSPVIIKLARGATLGTVEESFLSQLKIGDQFLFGGRRLKLVQYQNLTAYVRLAYDDTIRATVWGGSSLPFSAPLGSVLRRALGTKEVREENDLNQEIIALQNSRSQVPDASELLLELVKSREGYHLFLFPFEGKVIHDGLALLIADRLSQAAPSTLVISSNDYGFELLSKRPYDEDLLTSALFNPSDCYKQLEELINLHETSKAAFREIACIAGLVYQGFPQKQKSNRQLQMSSGLLFEVLARYDRNNLLLKQAKKETLDKYFLQNRLVKALERLQTAQLVIKHLSHFSPFSLPLYVERVSQRISTESLAQRVESIQKSWRDEAHYP